MDRSRILDERDRLLDVLEVVKERPRTVVALADQVRPFFAESVTYEPEAVERFWDDPAAAAERLEALAGVFSGVEGWDPETLETELRALADRRDEGAGKLIHPLRVALMGVAVSPGIFTVLHLMRRERTLRRIRDAVEHLRARSAA